MIQFYVVWLGDIEEHTKKLLLDPVTKRMPRLEQRFCSLQRVYNNMVSAWCVEIGVPDSLSQLKRQVDDRIADQFDRVEHNFLTLGALYGPKEAPAT